MSKVAAYLQEHILGEVTTQPATLNAMSHDASILELTPEMVIFPRVTNDIRKVARFCWQLAEKGHVLPITARGSGTDQTGAAIGKGIILSFPAYMNALFEFEPKQKLLRLQPGVMSQSVNDALRLHGVAIPSALMTNGCGTIGGAVANNASGPLSGRYGATGKWVYELEVVLANGEVLQTGRISKRDLNKKKGLQTFEGEIYRSLDNLIEDNLELIDKKINTELRDNVGYESIASVKRKDGSFDLTPLFIGSQGTLGIISEMIMRTEFVSHKWGVTIASFASTEAARDMLDRLRDIDPTLLNYYDGEVFEAAAKNGKKYEFYTSETKAVVIFGVDDFSERARARKLKKVAKLLTGTDALFVSGEGEEAHELLAACGVTSHLLLPAGKADSTPPLVDGAYIPPERFEDFSSAVSALATRHHVTLPLFGHMLDNVYYTRAVLQLHKIGDKQKLFKLLDEYSDCVIQHGGHLIGESGEGRVKSRFAYKNIDDDLLALFASIKSVFDPYGILNPGVKQPVEVKQLVAMLRSDYDTAALLPYIPRI
jgi:FAD/FMN-containing dehydrogenase